MLCLLGYGESVWYLSAVRMRSTELPYGPNPGGHLVSRSEITVGDLTSLLIYTG
jgi:hypothetical protein